MAKQGLKDCPEIYQEESKKTSLYGTWQACHRDWTNERDEATLIEIMESPDWVLFALDRRVVWEPGSHFVYYSPGMHLLSAILQHATGTTAQDFARQNLFEPLNITDTMCP